MHCLARGIQPEWERRPVSVEFAATEWFRSNSVVRSGSISAARRHRNASPHEPPPPHHPPSRASRSANRRRALASGCAASGRAASTSLTSAARLSPRRAAASSSAVQNSASSATEVRLHPPSSVVPGRTISSGRTQRSKSSGATWPSRAAASFRVMSSLRASFAIATALS